MSIEFINHQLNFDMPFLSGQMFAKCSKSSDGRSLSIGMQYLIRTFYMYDFIRHAKVLTILHATYPSIVSPATCE